MAIGDNKNIAYCHPLFTHNQSVTTRVADMATKSTKKKYNKQKKEGAP